MKISLPLPESLQRVLVETPALARAYLAGGAVRDVLLGLPVKDYDIEVYGLSYDELAKALAPWGSTDLIGKSFGVIKLRLEGGTEFDFSIPRQDSKIGPGHKGFRIDFQQDLSLEQAAARRDFTINALMYDPRREEVLDFFGGLDDLKNLLLRHTSAAFPEDPLRVLRGMQFAARFNLRGAPETILLCRGIKDRYAELAVERVREEWFKWAAKSVVPSAGLKFLRETEWIEHYPEFAAIVGVPQDPEWHPEGDVFIHTCHCCDALAELPEWKTAEVEARIVYMLGILTHDFGKAATTRTEEKDGQLRTVSPGHDETGEPLAEAFLRRINAPQRIIDRVKPLVRHHMAHLHGITPRAVRRLARRLEPENIQGLCLMMTADAFGRPPIKKQIPRGVIALRETAKELEVEASAPQPILKGRHLIDLGLSPGTAMGALLHEAFEAQLEGKFNDLPGAMDWAKKKMGKLS